MTKGISAVITVVLLLLIVVVIVGFTFGFFQSFVQASTEATEGQLNITKGQMQKSIRIDIASSTSGIVVRNTGSQTIQATELAVYFSGAQQNCAWSSTSVAAGRTITCDPNDGGSPPTSTPCTSGQAVKVTAPANEYTDTCV